jgi:pimeloyl-ACP methyl ester carboxylesterase
MACRLQAKAAILIGSCRSPAAFNPWALRLRPLLCRLPRWAITITKPLAPLGVQMFRNLQPENKRLFATMYQHADAEFMRWAIGAMLNWSPTSLAGTPVFHIHGRLDRIILASMVAADVIIPDGGHMINLSHAATVNDFIAKVLATVS